MTSKAAPYFPNTLGSTSKVRGTADNLLNEKEVDDLMWGVFLFTVCVASPFNSSSGTARSRTVQVTYHSAFEGRHLNARPMPSRTGRPRDCRQSFVELCVNLRTPMSKPLVNPALNQRYSSNIPDYNVAYIVKKTLLNALVNKSAFLPGAVL
jgi:hypothetical protein